MIVDQKGKPVGSGPHPILSADIGALSTSGPVQANPVTTNGQKYIKSCEYCTTVSPVFGNLDDAVQWVTDHVSVRHMFPPDGNVNCPACAEYAKMRHNPDQEAVFKFLDLELRRQRWEMQQILILLTEARPDLTCARTDCVSLDKGRMMPHVYNSECAYPSKKENM